MNHSAAHPGRTDIRALLEPVSQVSGKAYFDALTRLMCEQLGASIALVGRLSEDGKTLRTLSCFQDGSHTEAQTYPLAGTPCAKVVATLDRSFFVSDDAATAFPDDAYIQDHGIRAYMGHALTDEKGQVIGLLSALCTSPLAGHADLVDFMDIATPRTRAELQHDITLGQLREALSKALLLNYSKSMFMANISHELRNPISAMIGYASLIRSGQADKVHLRDYANEICQAGEGLLALISDILSLATMEISDDLARDERFDLVAVARAGRRLMQAQAAAKHLDIPAIQGTDPILALGDNHHTKKALTNLLSNAVKYTGTGRIGISVSRDSDGGARLSVADTGVGMTPEELTRATQPLGSFAHAYDMHQEGTGLGLPLTMLLMERQHGRLEIESEKGKGTTAHLVFPPDRVSEDDSDFI